MLATGALVLIGLLTCYLRTSAVPVLWPHDRTPPEGTNLIAVDLPQKSGGAWVWVTPDRSVLPLAAGRASFRFIVSSTNPGGVQFILGGPMTKGLHCFGDAAEVTTARYSDLSATAVELVNQFFRAVPITGVFIDNESEWSTTPHESQRDTRRGSYTVVTLHDFQPEDRKVTWSPGEKRGTTRARWADFHCTIEARNLWQRRAGIDSFTMPAVVARAHFERTPSYLGLSRDVDFVRNDRIELTGTNGTADYATPGRIRVTDASSTSAEAQPVLIGVNPSESAFARSNKEAKRERAVFLGGLAAATIASLVVALLKLAGDVLAERLSSRRTEPDGSS